MRVSPSRSGGGVAAVVTIAAAAAGLLAACGGGPAPLMPSPSASVTATTSPSGPATLGFSVGYRGLTLDDAELARQLDLDVQVGARWVRVDLDWSTVERHRGSDDWDDVDRVVAAARQRGLEVLALPGYTPDWAADGQGGPDARAYAAFVGRAVARYAPQGVRTWELWNEPNLHSAWGSDPDPQAYGRLLRAAVPAALAADPGATVLTGGLAPVPDRDGSSVAMRTFLEGLAAAGPVPGLAGVALHPYVYPSLPRDAPVSPTNAFGMLDELHDLARALAGPDATVWATEMGAPTGDDARAVSPQEQAETLRQAHALLGERPWAGPLLIYADRDVGADPGDREENFGLLDLDFRPKPAWAVFAELAAGR